MTNRHFALEFERYEGKVARGRGRGSTARGGPHSSRPQLPLTRQGSMSASWSSWRRPPPCEEVVGQQPRYLELTRLVQDQSVPFHTAQAATREDSRSLGKHLSHARRLASAVKQGRGYFHLLQKEEEEKEEEEARQRRNREERLRAPPHSPRASDSASDSSHSDSDRCPLPAGTSQWCDSRARPRRKKAHSARPFTPVHRSLTSPLVNEAPTEAVYRQLCCLNWLLEALTLERTGRAGPISSCWDYKDPGRGRTTLKTFNRERAIQSRWERFVCTPQRRRTGPRPPPGGAPSSSDRVSLGRSTSTLSGGPSSSVLAGSSSLSSLCPAGSEEEEEEDITTTASHGRVGGTVTPAAAGLWGVSARRHRTEPPAEGAQNTELMPASSEHLHPLLDEVLQRVRRELYGHSSTTTSMAHSLAASRPQPQPHGPRLPHSSDKASRLELAERSRPKSCPVGPRRRPAGSALIGGDKESMTELRAALEERAEETAQSYADVLEQNARNRLDSGLRKFRALRHVTSATAHHHHRLPPPRHVTTSSSVADNNTSPPGPGGGGGGAPHTTTTTTPANDNNNNNTGEHTAWLASLLSALPEEVRRERAVSRVLGKLSGLAEERVLLSSRVRPQLFLKVLGALQPWELCLPDLCVAIEIAREHVVQMPREEYDAWLCSRVTLPSQGPRHPPPPPPQATR